MKDDKTEAKVNKSKLGPESLDEFPEWTLTPADVDIDALLEEARKQMEKSGETLEEYISRTMGVSLDDYIKMTLQASPAKTQETDMSSTQAVDMTRTQKVDMSSTQAVDMTRTQKVDMSSTQAVDMTRTQKVDMSSTQAVDMTRTQKVDTSTTQQVSIQETRTVDMPEDPVRTRVVTEPIDWKQAEEEEAGYKGNEGRKTVSYGLSDEDVRDTISMERPVGEEQSEDEKEINERIRKRQKDTERREMRNRTRIKILLALLVTAVFLFVFSHSSFFTVDAIEVRGNSHFTAEEIINIAHASPGKNLIYNTGSKEIIAYLEQNPYIKEAVVARKLPSTLVISVNERKQACAFKYDDDYLVMDDEGILLKKTRTKPKITLVSGLVVSKIKLGEVTGTKDRKLFKKMLDLIQTTNAADMYFVSIDMKPEKVDEGVVKAYIYDTFIVKGQYDLLMTNLENGRLHRVVEKLFSQDIKRGTITFTEEGSISFEPGL